VHNIVLETSFHWLFEDIGSRSKSGLRNICKNVTLISDADCHVFGHSNSADGKSPWGGLRDEISLLAAVLLSYDICQRAISFCHHIIKSPLMIIHYMCSPE